MDRGGEVTRDRYDGQVDDLGDAIDDRLRRIRDELAAVESMVRQDHDKRISPADIGSILRAAREGIGGFLNPDLFADPAFDMLLFIFLEEEAGRSVETSACYRASGVPRTTAVRWINMLVSMGMFHSTPHPTDRRLALLSLSEGTRASVRQWLEGLRPLVERIAMRPAMPTRPVA
ncbi:hypothetical protein BSZ14_16375 [Sphingomonas sp. Sph1(2015)]|jgi:hypothetical protein|uniref:hypothetical protein n=1 Tax=Sphingomonas TaxID=13687 RepID=UPI0009762C6A|nr:hypothetical protein [Sphingomonas sp. Sph1(2015)]OMJ30887.1 hypothetical protein BSZ14_16375 [Sphingomonas sp. Sph1(2015)]